MAKTDKRQEYQAPKIVHSQKIEVRAVTCQMADQASCGGGPLVS